MTAVRFTLTHPFVPLWRGPNTLQVGLEPPDAVILHPVPELAAELVKALHQARSRGDLVRLLPGLGVDWIDHIIERLRASGLVAASAPHPASRFTIVGEGPLSEAVASGLAATGAEVHGSVPARLLEPGHAVARCDLALLAPSTCEPDRTVTDALMRAGQPHLVVRTEPVRSVVGPLVLPGRTPCVRCLDLCRRHHDPAWPRLLAQLCRTEAATSPALIGWAAATAVTAAQAYASGRHTEFVGRTVELSAADFTPRVRSWEHHPDCGCRWPV